MERYWRDLELAVVLTYTPAPASTVTFFGSLGAKRGRHSGMDRITYLKQLKSRSRDGGKHWKLSFKTRPFSGLLMLLQIRHMARMVPVLSLIHI